MHILFIMKTIISHQKHLKNQADYEDVLLKGADFKNRQYPLNLILPQKKRLQDNFFTG